MKFASWKYMSRVKIEEFELEELENLKTYALEYSGWSLKNLNETYEVSPKISLLIRSGVIRTTDILCV